MADPSQCPRCGAELPPDVPGGHCLRCLLGLGLTPPTPSASEARAPAAAGALPAANERPADFEQPGDRVGPYTLLRQIGEGGFGVVFLAEQQEPVHRHVALKVLKRGHDARAVVARFETERQALELMDHPNIARILDGGATAAGRPYFVMDYVSGRPITEYCDAQGLTVPQRLELLIQVCQAVQHAHHKGVIHRDLKPSNILVAEEDGRPVPKVIDFGIAKARLGHQLSGAALEAVAEQFAGTPAYMSPEQTGMMGLDVDARSDIYSLGVLLYELLISQPAFRTAQFQQVATEGIFRVIREREAPRPSARLTTLAATELAAVARRRQTDPARLPRLLRGELDWIVMKALEKDRNRRYQTAAGLAMELQRHLRHEPVLARPPSRLYRLRKLIRRHRAAFAGGAAVFLVLVAGLAVSLWFYSRERVALGRAVAAEGAERRQARHSQEFERLLRDMLEAVGPSVAQARDTVLMREILARATARLEQPPPLEPEIELDLRRTLGSVYADLGDFTNAEPTFRRALVLQRSLAPTNAVDLAALLSNFANLLAREDRLPEAEAAAREALALRETAFGKDSTNVALSLNALGNVLWFQRRFDEAASAYREGLAIHRRQPVPDAVNIAAALGNLGNVLALQVKPAEAEPLFREALALQRERLGESHPSVAKSTANLAHALSDQGKHPEAEALLRDSVARRRKILGPDHPDLAYSLHNLAAVLAQGTNLAEAESLYRESLAIRRLRLAPTHSLTTETMQNLGETLLRNGKLDEAAPVLRAALALVRERAAGKDHAPVADCLYSLALVLREQSQFAEADAALREALALTQRLRPGNDPAIARIRATLNGVLRSQGRPTE